MNDKESNFQNLHEGLQLKQGTPMPKKIQDIINGLQKSDVKTKSKEPTKQGPPTSWDFNTKISPVI